MIFADTLCSKVRRLDSIVPSFPSNGVWNISYLLVDICPIVDQQLQTEGTVGGDGGQVQRGVATLVGLVDVRPVVDQLGSHRLLPHVARHMERSVSEAIGLIDLRAETHTGALMTFPASDDYRAW